MIKKSFIDFDFLLEQIADKMDEKKLNKYDRDEISEIIHKIAEDYIDIPEAYVNVKKIFKDVDDKEEITTDFIELLTKLAIERGLMSKVETPIQEDFDPVSFAKGLDEKIKSKNIDLHKPSHRKQFFKLYHDYIDDYLKNDDNKVKAFIAMQNESVKNLSMSDIESLKDVVEEGWHAGLFIRLSQYLSNILLKYFSEKYGISEMDLITGSIERIMDDITKDDIKIGDIVTYHGNNGKVTGINDKIAFVDFKTDNEFICLAGKVGIPVKNLEKNELKRQARKRIKPKPSDIYVKSNNNNLEIYRVISKNKDIFVTERYDRTGKRLGLDYLKEDELLNDSLYKAEHLDISKIAEIISESVEYTIDKAIELLKSPSKESIEKAKDIYISQELDVSGIDRILKGIKQGKSINDLEILISEQINYLNDIQKDREGGESIPSTEESSAVEIPTKKIIDLFSEGYLVDEISEELNIPIDAVKEVIYKETEMPVMAEQTNENSDEEIVEGEIFFGDPENYTHKLKYIAYINKEDELKDRVELQPLDHIKEEYFDDYFDEIAVTALNDAYDKLKLKRQAMSFHDTIKQNLKNVHPEMSDEELEEETKKIIKKHFDIAASLDFKLDFANPLKNYAKNVLSIDLTDEQVNDIAEYLIDNYGNLRTFYAYSKTILSRVIDEVIKDKTYALASLKYELDKEDIDEITNKIWNGIQNVPDDLVIEKHIRDMIEDKDIKENPAGIELYDATKKVKENLKQRQLKRGPGSSSKPGTPKTDVERLMTHYDISKEEANELLKKKPIKELLPERGQAIKESTKLYNENPKGKFSFTLELEGDDWGEVADKLNQLSKGNLFVENVDPQNDTLNFYVYADSLEEAKKIFESVLDNNIQAEYKSDEDIEKEFENYEILSIEFKSPSSGYIELEFPEAEESVGGGTDYLVDNFIIYHDGRIAFENWYPEKIYNELTEKIRQELKQKQSSKWQKKETASLEENEVYDEYIVCEACGKKTIAYEMDINEENNYVCSCGEIIEALPHQHKKEAHYKLEDLEEIAKQIKKLKIPEEDQEEFINKQIDELDYDYSTSGYSYIVDEVLEMVKESNKKTKANKEVLDIIEEYLRTIPADDILFNEIKQLDIRGLATDIFEILQETNTPLSKESVISTLYDLVFEE